MDTSANKKPLAGDEGLSNNNRTNDDDFACVQTGKPQSVERLTADDETDLTEHRDPASPAMESADADLEKAHEALMRFARRCADDGEYERSKCAFQVGLYMKTLRRAEIVAQLDAKRLAKAVCS